MSFAWGDVREALAAERWRALEGLSGETIEFDTTDFSTDRTAMVVGRELRWLS